MTPFDKFMKVVRESNLDMDQFSKIGQAAVDLAYESRKEGGEAFSDILANVKKTNDKISKDYHENKTKTSY